MNKAKAAFDLARAQKLAKEAGDKAAAAAKAEAKANAPPKGDAWGAMKVKAPVRIAAYLRNCL